MTVPKRPSGIQPRERKVDVARGIEQYLTTRPRAKARAGLPAAIATVRNEFARRRWRSAQTRRALVSRRTKPSL
jgi:hypothetical protein